MSHDTGLDLVTGALSYSGSRIAERLLDSGRSVRTLTFHPDRVHPLQSRVQTLRFCFDDPVSLAAALDGVSKISGLTAGLLVSHAPPLGQIAFGEWLGGHSRAIGRAYANELHRHFSPLAVR